MILPHKFSKNSSKRGRRKQKNSRGLDYQNLEPRQLLAVDVGVNFTGSIFGTDSSALVPNANGDISATHSIEVVNGRFNAHNRFTGNRVMTLSLDQFFTNAGGVIITPTHSPKVMFDHISERFFVAAVGEGRGNWIHVAFSNTDDPTEGWQTVQFVADSTGAHFNDEVTLSLDADAIYLTTYNKNAIGLPDDVSVYSIPKADLFLPDPTITNMSRFEGLPTNEYGTRLQVASNFEPSDGKAVVIGSLNVSTKVMFEIYNTDRIGATISDPFEFTVDFGRDLNPEHVPDIPHDEYVDNYGEYYRNPDLPIQEDNPFGPAVSPRTGLTSNVVESNGSVWAAQTVSLVGVPFSSMINWFEVDVEARAVRGATPIDPEFDGNEYQVTRAANLLNPYLVGLRGPQSHLIRPEPIMDPPETFEYMFNPSIAVTPEGLIAISYNRISKEEPISVGVIAGTYVNGLRRHNNQFEGEFEIQRGFETYNLNTTGLDPWGYYGSIKVDPASYNGFYVTQPWANTTDRWSVQNTQISLVDMNPIIEADRGNNNIVMRRMAADPNLIEIEIDGNVTDVFPYDALGRVEIWGSDGSDYLLIDYSNGDPVPAGGFLFDGGAGPDIVETNNPDGSEFLMDQPDHPTFGANYPDYLRVYQIRFADDPLVSDGFYNETSELIDVEELKGGPGPDLFTFRGNWTMGGSASGQGGDDTFRFIDEPFPFFPFSPPNHSGVEENIIGGPGYDTIDFEGRLVPTNIELIGFGATGGFDGRVNGEVGEDLPIGGDIFQPDDVFREIEQALGSTQHLQDSLTFQPNVAGTWWIDDADSHHISKDPSGQDRRFDFYQWNIVNASNLNDTFNVLSNTVNPLALNGLAGDDVYTFSSTAPMLNGTTENIQELIFANAGPGANEIYASNIGGNPVDALIVAARVSGLGEFAYSAIGGTIAMEVWGTPFDDQIAVHSFLPNNTLVVRSFDGDDEYSIQDLSRASVKLYGGDGDDTYVLERVQGVSFRNLELIDSVDAEMDAVFFAGTLLNETFTIDKDFFVDVDFVYTGIEILGVDGREGNDTFNILNYEGDITILGGLGNDVFNFSSDGAGLLGDLDGFTVANITVDGGEGNNRLNVSNFSGSTARDVNVRDEWIEGLWNGRLYYASTGGAFTRPGDVGGILIRGSDFANDRFNVRGLGIEHSLAFEGVGGNDSFFVRGGALGNVRTVGDSGDDSHTVVFGMAPNRVVEMIDESAGGANRANFYGTDLDDTFYAFANSVQFATEMAVMSGNFVTLSVFGKAGNDEINLSGTSAEINRFFGDEGDDTFNAFSTLGATGLRVLLGAGNDAANLLSTEETTFSRVLGGVGEDVITIGKGAEGTVIADGEAGSDRYNVTFTATEERYVDVRDSGIGDMDITSIRGSIVSDEVEVRSNRMVRINEIAALGDETVVFGPENELVILNTVGGDDIVEMFASTAPTTRIQTDVGQDTININSTSNSDQLTIDMGDGDDLVNIYKIAFLSNVGVFGRGGNDEIVVGSNQVADNGNLGRIRGRLAVYGGANGPGGEDTLYINDREPAVEYAYALTPTSLRAIPGPMMVDRTPFQGIVFDSTMEFVRLDTTDLANYINVTPSSSTRFYIDGNAPNSASNPDYLRLLGDPSDGRELHILDANKGEGFWDFTDGTLDVVFEGIEETFDGTL